jgi:hypothetical protein
MHQNFRRNSQENIAIVSKKMMKKWNASGISLKIMLLFLCTLHALSTA